MNKSEQELENYKKEYPEGMIPSYTTVMTDEERKKQGKQYIKNMRRCPIHKYSSTYSNGTWGICDTCKGWKHRGEEKKIIIIGGKKRTAHIRRPSMEYYHD